MRRPQRRPLCLAGRGTLDQIDEVLRIALLPEKVNNAMSFVFPDEKKEKEESGYVAMTV